MAASCCRPVMLVASASRKPPGLRASRHPRLTEPVGVVGGPAAERLVRRSVEVRRGRGDEVELLAELEAVLGLRGRVWRIEGLDPVEADVADQALDQVADLLRVLDVPVGVGDDRDPARLVDQVDGLLGGRPLARYERLRARDQVLLEERPEVRSGAGGLGDVGAADRVGGARLRDRLLERDVDPVTVEVGDDLLGAVDPFLLGLRAGGGDLLEVDPVAADVQILGVLVHARHLERRDVLDPELGRDPGGLLDPGDAVVVGERHHRDPCLGGRAGDVARFELAVRHGGMALQVDHGARW